MMRLGDLTAQDLARRLRTSGISLRTGAFTTHLRLDFPDLADRFIEFYRDYEVEDRSTIDDFRVAISPTSTLRRFVRPQAEATIDGLKPFRPLPARIAYPMLESAMNWCIAQRVGRYLLLHAAALERDGYAVLLPAPSGSGKSTLCAALVSQGWRLLTDEISILDPATGCVVANPRPVGLKNESIDAIGRFAPSAHIGASYQGTIKGTVAFMRPPPASLRSCAQTARPALVVSPAFRPRGGLRLKQIEKARGFMTLAQNSINYRTCLRLGFETLANLVQTCDHFELSYGDLDQATGVIDQLHSARQVGQASDLASDSHG